MEWNTNSCIKIRVNKKVTEEARSETGEVKCQQTTEIAVGKVCGAQRTHRSPVAYAHFAQCLPSEGVEKGRGAILWGHRMSLLKVTGVLSLFFIHFPFRGIAAQLRNAKNRVACSMNYNVGPFNPYCVGEKTGSLLNKTGKKPRKSDIYIWEFGFSFTKSNFSGLFLLGFFGG